VWQLHGCVVDPMAVEQTWTLDHSATASALCPTQSVPCETDASTTLRADGHV
jgi:hypothetical protein